MTSINIGVNQEQHLKTQNTQLFVFHSSYSVSNATHFIIYSENIINYAMHMSITYNSDMHYDIQNTTSGFIKNGGRK